MVRVLAVDDSPSARALVCAILEADPEVTVVGEASDGAEAVEAVQRLHPDVITMDVVMPVMNGLDATRFIMAHNPTPIVIVASHDPDDAAYIFRAMEAGALTVLEKPSGPGSPAHVEQAAALLSTVKLIAGVRVSARRSAGPRKPVVYPVHQHTKRSVEVVAIAASTGGPAAVADIVRALPEDLPVPLLLVQHIAVGFDEALAEWLDTTSQLRVRIAADGDQLAPGTLFIAPSGRHLGVTRTGYIELSDAPPIRGFRPSATFMFHCIAREFGRTALGIILTGMGSDGVAGLLDLRRAGGHVIGQDEQSSVVYGMPGAAAEAGAVDRQLPIGDIGPAIRQLCN